MPGITIIYKFLTIHEVNPISLTHSYLWLSTVLAIESRRYIRNFFSHLRRTSTAIQGNGISLARSNLSKQTYFRLLLELLLLTTRTILKYYASITVTDKLVQRFCVRFPSLAEPFHFPGQCCLAIDVEHKRQMTSPHCYRSLTDYDLMFVHILLQHIFVQVAISLCL